MYTGIMSDSSSFDDNNSIDFLGEMVELERDKETISNMFNEASVGIEECLYFEDLLRIKTNDKYAIKAINTSLESAFIRNHIPRSISLESEEKKRNFILRIYDWIMEKLRAIKEWIMGLFTKFKQNAGKKKYEHFINNIDPVFFDYKGEANPDPKVKVILNKNFANSLFLNAKQEIETDTFHLIDICSNPSDDGVSYYSKELNVLENNIHQMLDISYLETEETIREKINNVFYALEDINDSDQRSPFMIDGKPLHKCTHPAKNPIFIKHVFADTDGEKVLKVSILTPTITNLSETYPSIKKYNDDEAFRTKTNSDLLIGLGKSKSIISELYELAISRISEATKIITGIEKLIIDIVNKFKNNNEENEKAHKLLLTATDMQMNIVRGLLIQDMNYVTCIQALLFNLVSEKTL